MFGISPTAISKVAKSVEVLMEEDNKFRKEIGGVISRFSARPRYFSGFFWGVMI